MTATSVKTGVVEMNVYLRKELFDPALLKTVVAKPNVHMNSIIKSFDVMDHPVVKTDAAFPVTDFV